MKKTLTLLMLTLWIGVNSQTKEFIIEHCMETKTFTSPEGLICSNEERSKWFMIQPTYQPDSYYPINKGFKVIKSGIGMNDKEDLLVFTFTDETVTVVKSINGPQEDGSLAFVLTTANIDALRVKTVSRIRFINVNDAASFTYEMTKDNENFFSNAFTNIIIRKIRCK